MALFGDALGAAESYWCKLDKVLEIENFFSKLEEGFSLFILIRKDRIDKKNRKISDKLGAIGLTGFYDLVKFCVYRTEAKTAGNEKYFYIDIMSFSHENQRCLEFVAKNKHNIGKDIFLFGVNKIHQVDISSELRLYLRFFDDVDTNRHKNGMIDADIISHFYFEFLKNQLARNGLAFFAMWSDYSLEHIIIANSNINFPTQDSLNEKFLNFKYYNLITY